MDREAIFEGLNPQQREAVEAVGGPVCILAGAGSGKTTTITRRIANQVASGAFLSSGILAVPFTDKAAGEMRARLAGLGVEGLRARTFHSAALRQLRYFSPHPPPQIMASKVQALRQIANTLPKPYRFRPAADLATEVEWAKNRRVDAGAYLSSLDGHEPPIPADLMASVYKRYERGKADRNLIDFEDLLELTIQMFDGDELALEEFRAGYTAFTVDEYQDVNLLQETLLRTWLGERDQLCVVGDDYQSIYGFTGATPRYLLEMPQRFLGTKVVRLEANYRSTPQILEMANRLTRRLGGAKKTLRATRSDGPRCILKTFSSPVGETAFLVAHIEALHREGVAYEEIAVLYRLNFRSEDYEEALAAQGIPYQVRDGAFLTRQSARQMLASLRRRTSTAVRIEVTKLAERAGYLEDPGDDLGEREITRQNDLARFIRLAEEFDDGTRSSHDFVLDIEGRFGTEGGRGVNLLTYHRAKGLEFEAVFLPQLQDGELPFKRARTDDAVAEERRLFYVGITRAKTNLVITSINDGRRKASTFVGELREPRATATPITARPLPRSRPGTIEPRVGLRVQISGGFEGEIVDVGKNAVTVALGAGVERTIELGERVTVDGKTLPLARGGDAAGGPAGDAAEGPGHETDEAPALAALKRWRRQRSQADEVPAFVVFHDSTLEEIVRRGPRTLQDLQSVPGIGPLKLERYGSDLLSTLRAITGSPAEPG